MASTTPSVKSQKPGRLYICTAQWFEKSTRYTRDFVIYALTKAEASQIVKNHIPKEIRESVSDNNNLTIMTRDYGTPKPWRTYFSSDIRISDKTSDDMPSAMEMTAITFASLWGKMLKNAVSANDQVHLDDSEFMIQTIYKWSKEYLYSANITKTQFFLKKMEELGITVNQSEKDDSKPEESSEKQIETNADTSELIIAAHMQADQIINDAHEKALTIITDATNVQKRIYSDAQTYSHSLMSNTMDDIQNRIEAFELAVQGAAQKIDTAQDKALLVAEALQQILNTDEDDDDLDMEPDEQVMDILSQHMTEASDRASEESNELPAETSADPDSDQDYEDQQDEPASDEPEDETDDNSEIPVNEQPAETSDNTSDDDMQDDTDFEESYPEDPDASMEDYPENIPDNIPDDIHDEIYEDSPADNIDDTDSDENNTDASDDTSAEPPVNQSPAPSEHFQTYKPVYDFNDIDINNLRSYLIDPNNRLLFIIPDKNSNEQRVYNLSEYLEAGRRKTLQEHKPDPFNNPSWLWKVLRMSRTPDKHSALTAYLKLNHIPPENFILPDKEFWKTYTQH